MLCAISAAPALAADEPLERLKVTDPYIELRTGPGRGYPVFFVAARDETIEVELRHTDWFKVRTAGGKQGWVHREQLERTLTDAGDKKTFRDVLLDDYLRRRFELGAAWGIFNSEPMLKLWTSYKLSSGLSLEGTLGQVQGVYSGTNFWSLNIAVEPWAEQRFSPFFGLGVGQFQNIPNASLVGAETTNAKLANVGLGLRYHISDRFVARLDYSLYTAFLSDSQTREFRATTLGISFFF
jgi:Bacterial SH3 domain